MGHYYKTIKDNFSAYKNSDKAMWGSIELVDDLLEDIKEAHPDKYWEFMRRTHEMMYGMHFDSAYAEWQVEHMYHIGDDGREYIGEHWSLKDTTTVMQKYRARIPGEYNEYDFYVALNTHWHDTICTAKRHFRQLKMQRHTSSTRLCPYGSTTRTGHRTTKCGAISVADRIYLFLQLSCRL